MTMHNQLLQHRIRIRISLQKCSCCLFFETVVVVVIYSYADNNVSSIACNATALWRWQHTTHRISLLLWMHQEKWVKLSCRSSEIKFIVLLVCVCLTYMYIQVYVWGDIPQLQNDDKTPMETNLQSLDEVFCLYGDGTMYRTLKIGTPIL